MIREISIGAMGDDVEQITEPPARVLNLCVIGGVNLRSDAVLTRKPHVPDKRISMEAVIRFCNTGMGVEPLRANWDSALTKSRKLFEKWRTWP